MKDKYNTTQNKWQTHIRNEMLENIKIYSGNVESSFEVLYGGSRVANLILGPYSAVSPIEVLKWGLFSLFEFRYACFQIQNISLHHCTMIQLLYYYLFLCLKFKEKLYLYFLLSNRSINIKIYK